MDRRARPLLRCLFAIAAIAVAPACLAQQATAPTEQPEAQVRNSGATTATGAPRSAFGKVMSLLISALQQNADASGIQSASAPSADLRLDFEPAAVAAPPARDIQVSAAFQLAPAANSGPDSPATASID